MGFIYREYVVTNMVYSKGDVEKSLNVLRQYYNAVRRSPADMSPLMSTVASYGISKVFAMAELTGALSLINFLYLMYNELNYQNNKIYDATLGQTIKKLEEIQTRMNSNKAIAVRVDLAKVKIQDANGIADVIEGLKLTGCQLPSGKWVYTS